VNPARIKGFAQGELNRTKNDKVDASLIARFCQAMKPKPWRLPSPEIRDLQALVRRLDALVAMRNQEANRLDISHNSPRLEASINKLISFLDKEIKATKELIKNHIVRHPDLKAQRDLLLSIPGIGEATSAVLLGELCYIKTYNNARQLVAYAGLAPKQHLSGSTVQRISRVSKTSNAQVRKALYFPAIVVQRYNPCIKEFCQRLPLAGKNKMQVICAAMRKLLHLAFGVLKSNKPFDPSYAAISS